MKMTPEEQATFVAGVAAGISEIIARVVGEMTARAKALEARIAELERQAAPSAKPITLMQPIDRIRSRISEFLTHQSEYDADDMAITGTVIARSDRGAGPGWSMYANTRSGIGFEEPLTVEDFRREESEPVMSRAELIALNERTATPQ